MVGNLAGGQQVILQGEFKKDSKYGIQFDARGADIDLDPMSGGLAAYIANHPDIKFISDVRAKQLVERWGSDLARIAREKPQEVAESVKGLQPDHVIALAEVLESESNNKETRIWLASLGLSHNQINTLVKQYGSQTMQVVKDNPYRLITDLVGYGFRKADDIALRAGLAKSNPYRIEAGLIYCVNGSVDQGHTYIERASLIKDANETLALDTIDAATRINETLNKMVTGKDRPLVESQRVYESGEVVPIISTAKMYSRERDLAQWAKANFGQPVTHEHISDRVDDNFFVELNEDQHKAVTVATTSPISIITGGAGVGKTFVLRKIIKLFRMHKMDVSCAAPTGKAARRITESTGYDASTIHRLLGYNPELGGWEYNAFNKLEDDVIIVDECSMLDTSLAWRLFSAIDFERTVLILVGDDNQIPPVSAGHVFRDLKNSGYVPVAELRKVIRQAGALKRNSLAILNKTISPTEPTSDGGAGPWYRFTEHPETKAKFVDTAILRDFLHDMIVHYISRSIEDGGMGFDARDDVQVLTPTHKGNLGTIALNRILQRSLQKVLFGVDVTEPPSGRDYNFYVGDKVIQTRNDQTSGTVNGQVGIVTKVEPKGRLWIQFEEMPHVTELSKDKTKYIQLAYACTIHKYQGSQVPCSIVICHKSHSYQLNRNLLYTAVTRSSQCTILVGDGTGMRSAVAKTGDARNTLLSLLRRPADAGKVEENKHG